MVSVTKTDGFKRIRSAAEALRISAGDLGGPVLVRMGQVHVKQMRRVFASEGASGASGPWPALSPNYEKRKRKVLGRRKKLVLTGRTKERFTKASNPGYIQKFTGGDAGGVFRFGAASDIAAAHRFGDPGLAGPQLQSAAAAIIFSGTAKRLPVRDMISKTGGQIADLRARLAQWYREERIPQVLRNLAKLRKGA